MSASEWVITSPHWRWKALILLELEFKTIILSKGLCHISGSCIHTHTHTHTHTYIVELALNEVGLHYTEYLGKSGFIWFL